MAGIILCVGLALVLPEEVPLEVEFLIVVLVGGRLWLARSAGGFTGARQGPALTGKALIRQQPLTACRLPRQSVAPFILRMAGMALDPVPVDLVTGHLRVQCLPEVDVFHRLPGGGFPAVALPAVDPLGDALAQILAVGKQLHLAGLGKQAQPLNGRQHLHAVVGGALKTLRMLLAVMLVDKDNAKTSRTGIAQATAIGI